MLEQLKKDMFQAMKDKDAKKKEALQMVINTVNTEAKEGREVKVEDVIAKEIKQLQESKDYAQKNNREELIELSDMKIAILESYLPQKLTTEELTAIVKEKIAELDTNNMGLIIKAVRDEVGVRAEGKMISEVVKNTLGN